MSTKDYLYKSRSGIPFVVVASSKAIAQWYVKNTPGMSGTFLHEMTPGERVPEMTLACPADTVLRDTVASLTQFGDPAPKGWPAPPPKENLFTDEGETTG